MKRSFMSLAWPLVPLATLFGGVVLSSAQPPFDEGARHVVEAHAPSYERSMWQLRREGRFVVAATVLPSGVVHNASVLESAFDAIDSKIVGVAKRWKFEPSESTTIHKIEFVFELVPIDAPGDDAETIFVAPASMVIRAKESAGISTGFHPRPRVK